MNKYRVFLSTTETVDIEADEVGQNFPGGWQTLTFWHRAEPGSTLPDELVAEFNVQLIVGYLKLE